MRLTINLHNVLVCSGDVPKKKSLVSPRLK